MRLSRRRAEIDSCIGYLYNEQLNQAEHVLLGLLSEAALVFSVHNADRMVPAFAVHQPLVDFAITVRDRALRRIVVARCILFGRLLRLVRGLFAEAGRRVQCTA